MDVSPNVLRRETVQLIQQINAQIKQVERKADEMGCKPEELRNSSDGWVMTPLLLAKAQAYNTLVLLNQK